MRTLFAILLFLPLTLRAMPLLDAIAYVETGNNDRAVGRAGEVSRWQLLPAVWAQYSSSTAYTKTATAREVAGMHLEWLKETFKAAKHFEPSETDLALMWRSGFKGYQKRGFNPLRMSAKSRDRANRIINITKL